MRDTSAHGADLLTSIDVEYYFLARFGGLPPNVERAEPLVRGAPSHIALSNSGVNEAPGLA